ncbi:MAG: acetylglutamate kinase [Flavobacteriaceae bacterium]|nr:acetylglutamate kinase [Flavobacteriaceae bacterium]MDG2502909.1 acetylglutamate kinase [Flavobacteriaceae bacterium]
MDKLQIVKIGGNVIENRMALEEFLTDFSQLKEAKILVHGGGKEATQMAEKLGIPVQLIDGRRITDAANLEIISMLYAGKLNKTIVAQLQATDCNALGLSGADGNSIRAEKRAPKSIDFGFVGDVTAVNTSLFNTLLAQEIAPVCCAITHDKNGQLLNTNADTIASEIAIAMSAHFEVSLNYCFEKKGVLQSVEDENSVIPIINSSSYEILKNENTIHSGMLPKIHNCFEALKKGVNQVRIGSPKMITGKEIHTQIQL